MVFLCNDNDNNNNMTMMRMTKATVEVMVKVKGLKVPSGISKMEEENDDDNNDENNGSSGSNGGSVVDGFLFAHAQPKMEHCAVLFSGHKHNTQPKNTFTGENSLFLYDISLLLPPILLLLCHNF